MPDIDRVTALANQEACSRLIDAFPKEKTLEDAAERALTYLNDELLQSYERIKTLLSDDPSDPSDADSHCRRLRSALEARTSDFAFLVKTSNHVADTDFQSCTPCQAMSCVRECLQSSIPPEVLLSRAELMQEINRFDELAAQWTVCGHRHARRLSIYVSGYVNSLQAATESALTVSDAHRSAERYPPQVRRTHNAALSGVSGRAEGGQRLMAHSDPASCCYPCTLGKESAFAQKANLLRALAHTPLDPTERAAAVHAYHLDSVHNLAARNWHQAVHREALSRSRPSFEQRTDNDGSGDSDDEAGD